MSLDDIGEEADALTCLTNNFECCGENDRVTGKWYFPNSSPVPLASQEHNVYITRGPSLVRLHHRRNFMVSAGLFHCEIPDASGTNQNIYIGVYPDHPGAGICK